MPAANRLLQYFQRALRLADLHIGYAGVEEQIWAIGLLCEAAASTLSSAAFRFSPAWRGTWLGCSVHRRRAGLIRELLFAQRNALAISPLPPFRASPLEPSSKRPPKLPQKNIIGGIKLVWPARTQPPNPRNGANWK